MKCIYCDNEIEEGADFCIHCGAKVVSPVKKSDKPRLEVREKEALTNKKVDDSFVKEPEKRQKTGLNKSGLVFLLFLLLLLGCAVVWKFIINNKNQNVESNKLIELKEKSVLATAQNIKDPEKKTNSDIVKIDEDIRTIEEVENEIIDDLTPVEDDPEVTVIEQTRCYKGSIDGKYAITADLYMSESTVKGSYYYDKYGPNNRLTLRNAYEKVKSYGEIYVLQEYDANGREIGVFRVDEERSNNEHIEGTYINISSGKEMPFVLTLRQSKISSPYGYAAGRRILTESELSGFSKEELRVLRNEIYARHGHIFKSEDLTNYFSRFSWYDPDTENAFNRLSDIEKKNIDKIKSMEASALSRQIDLSMDVVSISR